MDMYSDLVPDFMGILDEWRFFHPVQREGFDFAFEEQTDTTLDFQADGMLFRFLPPAGFLQGKAQHGETLVVVNLDKLAPDSLMLPLNEKLGSVPIGEDTLEDALSVFAKAFNNFLRKRKRADKDEPRQKTAVARPTSSATATQKLALTLFKKKSKRADQDEPRQNTVDAAPTSSATATQALTADSPGARRRICRERPIRPVLIDFMGLRTRK